MDELISVSERVYSTLDDTLLAVIDDFCNYTRTSPVFTEGISVIWQVNKYLITETNICQQEKVIAVLRICQIGVIIFQGRSYRSGDPMYNVTQLLADINRYVHGTLNLEAITQRCSFLLNR